MKTQKNILSFFSPVTRKQLSENDLVIKRVKVEEPINDINSGLLAELAQKYPIVDPEMGDTWFHALQTEFKKRYFKELNDFIVNERKGFKVYPVESDVWSWTKFCAVEDIKVVIIGQDPYHNPRQAHGLSFSVPKPVNPPPSLVNIFKELTSDIEGFKKPSHGDLTSWAKQGVLLLNACLTVRENAPNSHTDKGWEKITDAVINVISQKNTGVVFFLWGAFAQKKAACVDTVSL